MIGGRMVVEDGRVTTVDMAALRRDVEAARARLERANQDNRVLGERLAPIVARFCPGLARVPYHINRYGAPMAG
jgi:guanine deaminase